MSNFTIEPFFPNTNLNPQGWITDFITSRLHRVGKDRSDLANLIYDDVLTEETIRSFKITNQLKDEIHRVRARSAKDKSIFLNPKYYDAVEKNAAISYRVLESERDLVQYYNYMINAKPSDLAVLMPFINLKFAFKQPNEQNYKEAEVPFVSNLSTEVASILANPLSRGQGAGIKSINVEKSFPGLGLTLNVNVNITYFFSSLSQLTKAITNQFIPEEEKFCYAKLISFLPRKKQRLILEYGYGTALPQQRQLDTIMASEDEKKAAEKQGKTISQLGDNDIAQANKISEKKKVLQNVLKAERKRIALVYKGHKINIQEDGTVLVDASYLAESEAQLFQRADISVPNITFLQKLDRLEESTKTVFKIYDAKNKQYFLNQKQIQSYEENVTELQQTGGNSRQVTTINKQKDELKKTNESIAKELSSIKAKISPYLKQIFLQEIIRRKQMFAVSFETSKTNNSNYTIKTNLKLQQDSGFVLLKEFVTSKSKNNFKNIKIDSLRQNTLNLKEQDLFEQILRNLFDSVDRSGNSKEFGMLFFFPLKALISILYELLPDNKDPAAQYDFPFTCFGNLVVTSFGKEYSVNIGDILIEKDTFLKWLYRNFEQKIRFEYSFSDVLKDIVEELVPEAIAKNSTGFYKTNSIGSIRHLIYYTKKTTDPAMIKKLYRDRVDFDSLRSFFVTERDRESEPLIYYAQVLNPINDSLSPYHRKYIARGVLNRNSYSQDQDSLIGTPHVSIGANTGLIKKVDFSSIEQPFLATSLIMQSMTNGSTRLPRYAYNISVKMVGNNLFNQAGFLVVPPFGLEYDKSSVDTSLGLTGYYVITKVSDSLSVDGSYDTSVSAIFHDDPLWLANKGNKATTKDGGSYAVPQEYIVFTVEDYVKDLLELDTETLKALGITALPKNTNTQSTNTEKQNKNKNSKKPRRDTPQ